MASLFTTLVFVFLLSCAVFVDGGSRRRGFQKHPEDNSVVHNDNETDIRSGKLLPLFSVVRFPNDPCRGNSGKNGTCYTMEECRDKTGGVSEGTCAQGFGVCCTFSIGCGGQTNENCTYFESSGGESGSCVAKVCKCSSNICQLRLDFETFVINGPDTTTTSTHKILFGEPAFSTAKGVGASTATQCLTDTFSVLVPGGNAPPTICGSNSGEHMYLDASDCCNDLAFQLGTSSVNRAWSIKISQYDCDYENLAPEGCTQYFYGSESQTVRTFNFQGGLHLSDQNQNICVRQERGNCQICWTTLADTDLQLSGSSTVAGFTTQTLCCGYGSTGSATFGYDCVTIPGALKMNGMLAASRVCGRSKGLVTTLSGPASTICSMRTPFSLRFLSDSYEFAGADSMEAAQVDLGFQLVFFQRTGCA